jgi:biopolymer transport protein ExbD
MRVRRIRKEVAHLEVTAFINLIVVLVPFLLSTAVLSRFAVLDLTLPAQSGGLGGLSAEKLQLEVVIRPDALDVGDRVGGLIQHLPNGPSGYDTAALSSLLLQIKTKYPTEKAATILSQPDTSYDTLVQVMDASRSTLTADGTKTVSTELFPSLSLGDAPEVAKVK